MSSLGLGMAIRDLSKRNLAETQAATASANATEARHQGERLQADVDKLFLITQALWELLKTEHGYTDEVLRQKVADIDLLDGKLDGKAPKEERPDCPSCGRKMGRVPTCLYCGATPLRNPFER